MLQLKLKKTDQAQIKTVGRASTVISRVSAIIGIIAGIVGAVHFVLPTILKVHAARNAPSVQITGTPKPGNVEVSH
jgi:hypothetical protein